MLYKDSNVVPNTEYLYTFTTLDEIYDDGTSKKFLHGELKLTNVNTLRFKDSNPDNWKSVRMSVGWRNPQEDAYDVTSFTATYDSDSSKITWEAVDGYAFGGIDSYFYGFKWDEDNDVETSQN